MIKYMEKVRPYIHKHLSTIETKNKARRSDKLNVWLVLNGVRFFCLVDGRLAGVETALQ